VTTKTRTATNRQSTASDSAKADGATNNSRLSFRVPPQLATPTDLPAEAVQAISQSINGLIADAFALYVKTKNFHWHLASSHFRDYHLLLDEQAAEILASIDPLAERVRKVGGTTLRSIGHISQLQSLSDNDADFVPPEQMIKSLLDDNCQMVKSMRDAHDITDEQNDYATSSLLEELLDLTEKRIWLLYEISTGGPNEA